VNYHAERYYIAIHPNSTLVVKAHRYQQKALIIAPAVFAMILLVIIYLLSSSLRTIDFVPIIFFGLVSYIFTIYLIRKNLWEKIKIIPPFFYGFSLLVTTLVGILFPILEFGLFNRFTNSSLLLEIELGFLFFSVIYFVSLSMFMLSIRAESIFDLASGEAVYHDRYLIFPYILRRTMNFRKNNFGYLQLLLKSLRIISKETKNMSRISVAHSYSEEEFVQIENEDAEFLVVLYDPLSNPVIESVLCFQGKKKEVIRFLEILQSHIHYKIKKVQDAKITTSVFGNAKSEAFLTEEYQDERI
jgi:hypothetical protein